MIKAHDGRLEANHKHQVSGRNVSINVLSSLSQHQYQHIITKSSLKSAKTIRIPLLVCSYLKRPQGGSITIDVELE